MLFLQSHGVTTSLAVKIYKQYGDDLLRQYRTTLTGWRRTFMA